MSTFGAVFAALATLVSATHRAATVGAIAALVIVVGVGHAATNESPAEFFQFADNGAKYVVEYIKASNITHRYDTIVIYPSLFILRNTKGPIGPVSSISAELSELRSGTLYSTYRGWWTFRGYPTHTGGIGMGTWNKDTGWPLIFEAQIPGTICAKDKYIVITFTMLRASGGNIAARSKKLGTCIEPTPEYLAHFDFPNTDDARGSWSPGKIECVYTSEYHEIRISP